MPKTDYVDRDLELAFIREFSVGGLSLVPMSADERRERIRVAIYAQKRDREMVFGTQMTYSEAYEKCYRRKLEMRRFPRDQPIPSHAPELSDDPDDDDADWT